LTNRTEVAEQLLRVYVSTKSTFIAKRQLERVEWIHHPLHLPTFLSQYNAFFQMDRSLQSHPSRLRWLALLFIVLCLGAHFGDDENFALEERMLQVGYSFDVTDEGL
jgi:hypothetical protein